MRPRLEWLETFLAIADTGSLTRAAERVARSQSAVSLQLQRLEAVVGARLFERDTRSVVLSHAGERLIPLARRTLDAAGTLVLAARDAPPRVLRIGVPEEYADTLVPGLLEAAGVHLPAVVVEVQCAASETLAGRLDRGELGLAFALADEVGRRGSALLDDPVEWFQAPGGGLSERRPLPVALFDTACSWRRKALEALEHAGVDYRVVFSSASVAGVRAGIRAGFAVGALARSTAGDGLVALRGAGAPPALRPARVVVLRGAVQRREVAQLVESLRHRLAA